MKYNKIEVLFFSKNAHLTETFLSLFSDEVDFNCRSLSSIDALFDLAETPLNRVFLIDLSNNFYTSNITFYKRRIRLLSLPIIFILDKKKSKVDFKKEGFNYFDTFLMPINVDELLSTIRILLGDKLISNEIPIFIRGNCFMPKKNIFETLEGKSIKLTEKETKIIHFLYESRGEVKSKKLILRAIWGYKETLSTHTLETHIYRLRKKLKTGLNEKDLILKSPQGYFLNLL